LQALAEECGVAGQAKACAIVRVRPPLSFFAAHQQNAQFRPSKRVKRCVDPSARPLHCTAMVEKERRKCRLRETSARDAEQNAMAERASWRDGSAQNRWRRPRQRKNQVARTRKRTEGHRNRIPDEPAPPRTLAAETTKAPVAERV